MSFKNRLARFLLTLQLKKLDSDENPLNRLMGRAVRLQKGQLRDEQFRADLEEFFSALKTDDLSTDVALASRIPLLKRPGGYKSDILDLARDRDDHAGLFARLWRRRFGLLRRLNIRLDVIILRKGEQIPPHAHRRVVSGFYVLKGSVGIRHYDVGEQHEDHLLLRKALDFIAQPGGYGTNSEDHQNVHWLYGFDEASFLFRVSVTDTPRDVSTGSSAGNDRIYVDPTGPALPNGLVKAPLVSESIAKSIQFEQCTQVVEK